MELARILSEGITSKEVLKELLDDYPHALSDNTKRLISQPPSTCRYCGDLIRLPWVHRSISLGMNSVCLPADNRIIWMTDSDAAGGDLVFVPSPMTDNGLPLLLFEDPHALLGMPMAYMKRHRCQQFEQRR